MRLYGGKFLKNKTGAQVERKVESRDALVYDVLPAQRKARVKIQGSSTLVVCNYPENWEATPYWLKAGNTVRISHTGGVRGRIELVGNGGLAPTPVAGDPGIPGYTPGNAIIYGLSLSPGTGMSVNVASGRVRFSGTESNVTGTSVTINTAPSAGQFRYDVISVSPALVVTYTAGTASASPTMPATPSGHLRDGWLLIPGGATADLGSYINAVFAAAFASRISMVIADADLAWSETSTTVTIYIYDQYGNLFSTSGTMTLACDLGNGTVSDGGSKSFTGSSVAFTYTRGGNDPGDISPTLKAAYNTMSAYGLILLRDVAGDIMY